MVAAFLFAKSVAVLSSRVSAPLLCLGVLAMMLNFRECYAGGATLSASQQIVLARALINVWDQIKDGHSELGDAIKKLGTDSYVLNFNKKLNAGYIGDVTNKPSSAGTTHMSTALKDLLKLHHPYSAGALNENSTYNFKNTFVLTATALGEQLVESNKQLLGAISALNAIFKNFPVSGINFRFNFS